MQKFFHSLSMELASCTNDAECRVRFISGLRLLLQQTDYALLEWISTRNLKQEQQPAQKYVQALIQPTDGSLVDALEALLISAEQAGWSGASRALFLPLSGRPAARICDNGDATFAGLLRNVVARRNDGAEGHGLPGGYDREAECDALVFLLSALENFIPSIAPNGSDLLFGPSGMQIQLSFLKSWDRVPSLIRKVKVLASNRTRVYCQRIAGPLQRENFNYDSSNPFHEMRGYGLPQLIAWENSWNPLCYLPDRTTDSFTGRDKELSELVDWFDDVGSRACLVFGDGGFGKTTLTIEFLHQVLDEDITASWRPSIVVFYTAKRTQWGLNGLSAIGVGQPHLIEMLAQIHQLLFSSYPEADFYRSNVAAASSKIQTKIKQSLRFNPSDILIVVDNTETLISSDEERQEFGKELREITRRVGRVLLTSRRRELLEAVPIQVDVLSEKEAIQFLRSRGTQLGSKLLARTSDPDLLKEISSLERRPIVLEAFANAAAEPGVRKIQDATSRIAAMLQKELGDFLFADAWGRLAPDVRRVLLLMARVGDAHDAQSLKICADVIGVPVSAAEQALEESGGIASIVVVQGQPQITFSRNFLEFAKTKTVSTSSGVESPTAAEVSSASNNYSNFVKDVQKYTGDRVGEAFRTPVARAAHQAKQKGKFEEALRHYRAAVLNDATNGWLRDRFAYFLFHDIRDNEAALHQAKKAVELLPDAGEAWFTRGLIEAREGMARACEISMGKAAQLGVPSIRCDIQRAWAYLKSRPVQLPLAKNLITKIDREMAPKSDHRARSELELLKGRYEWLNAKYGRDVG